MLIEDMESFLPSEVARLVYGYLEEENCFSAAQAFLETSEHLQECLSVAKKGRKFNTRIMGRNLTGLFDMLSEVASLVKEYAIDVSCDLPLPTKLNGILRLLQINLDMEKYKTSSVSITSTSQGDESILDGQLERLRKKVEISLSPDTQTCNSDGDKSCLIADRNIESMSCEGENQDMTLSSCDHHPSADQFMLDQDVHNQDTDQVQSREPDDPVGLSIKKELYPELEDTVQTDGCSDNEVYSTEHREQLRYDQGGSSTSEGSSAGQQQEHNPHHQQQQSSSSSILFQSYNMLHMIQPQQQAAMNVQQTYQPPNVPTVYMHTIPPQVTAIQNGLCAFGANNSVQPAIMSSVTTPTSQKSLWAKVKTPKSRKQTFGSRVAPSEHTKLSPRKRYRNLKPSTVPKLRPIAPKITQVLDNGVEVQVVHTKEAPLVDLTETIPSILRRALRSRTKADSTNIPDDGFHQLNGESMPPSPGQPPPSPLFIDIQNFELKR